MSAPHHKHFLTLMSAGLSDAYEWLEAAHLTNSIPVNRRLEDVRPTGQFGRLCEIGVGRKVVQVRVLNEPPANSVEEFWALPKDVLESMTQARAIATG